MGWKNWSYWLRGGIILITIILIISIVPIADEFLSSITLKTPICFYRIVNTGQGDFAHSNSFFCDNIWFPLLQPYFHDIAIIFYAFIVGALLGAITGSILRLINQNNNKKIWPLWLIIGWVALVIINIFTFKVCKGITLNDPKCLQNTIISNFTEIPGLGVDMRLAGFLFFLAGAAIGAIIGWIVGKIKKR